MCTCGINLLFKSGAKHITVKLKLKSHLLLLSKSPFRRLWMMNPQCPVSVQKLLGCFSLKPMSSAESQKTWFPFSFPEWCQEIAEFDLRPLERLCCPDRQSREESLGTIQCDPSWPSHLKNSNDPPNSTRHVFNKMLTAPHTYSACVPVLSGFIPGQEMFVLLTGPCWCEMKSLFQNFPCP